MWISRRDYQELLKQRAEADFHAASAKRLLASERQAHRTTLRELLRRVRVAEQREAQAVELAATERAENRTAERWWANALLRAKQAFPMPAKEAPGTELQDTSTPRPTMDPGEYEALREAGLERGLTPAQIDELLRREGNELPQ